MHWVGGLAANGDVEKRRLATVAGVELDEVYRVGSLVVAGARPPQRFQAATALVAGEVHDPEDLAVLCDLPPDAPWGLIVAKGYVREGVRFLRRLRGSYHVALWDDDRRVALLAPDHLGSRAIFYTASDGQPRFASDIAPLLDAMPRAAEPDPDTIPRWISHRSLPDGLTLFRGISRLPTGELLSHDGHRWRVQLIWQPEYVEPERLSVQEASERIRLGVTRAVGRRLTLDGRTGILLSGGFDSGTLAGTAAPLARASGHVLPAFSSVFPGEPWDESQDIRVLVDAFGLRATACRPSGGTLFTASQFQDVWRLPQVAPGSILDTPLLQRAEAEGMRVMLDGQGGDELFAASPYLLTDLVLAGRLSAAWRLAHCFPGVARRVTRRQLQALVKQIVVLGALPSRVQRRFAPRSADEGEPGWLTARSRAIADALEDPWAWKRRLSDGPRWWAFLAYLQVDARGLAGMQDYLRRRGAAAGVDSRQPLLTDVDLVSLMLSMPPELAFSAHHDRALARVAMRGIVPEQIRVPRRKSNYAELMFRTLAEHDIGELRRILEAHDAEVGAFVDLALMRRMLLESPPHHGDLRWQEWSHHVWGLATTEMWLRSEALGDQYSRWLQGLGLSPPIIDMVALPDGERRP